MTEVVIRIPDNMDLRNYDIPYDILNIITNGKQLPKGHGKLVDQEILFVNLFQRNALQNITLQELSQLIKEATIVEADTEGEE